MAPRSDSQARTSRSHDNVSEESDARKHVCSQCGKRFKAPESLTRHMGNHESQRPHGCTLCSASFTRKDLLSRHIKTHVVVSVGAEPNPTSDAAAADTFPGDGSAAGETQPRQSDAVNDKSGNSILIRKRKRTRKACDQCFLKRTKCDYDVAQVQATESGGTAPESAPSANCSECQKAKTVCTFQRACKRVRGSSEQANTDEDEPNEEALPASVARLSARSQGTQGAAQK